MLLLQALVLSMRHLLTPPPGSSEEGQGLVEYALILVLVSVAALALMLLIGPQISNMFQNILDGMREASGA
jgi:pilus assembly protein Flp/PilA